MCDTDGVVEFMAELFRELVEDDVFADKLHVGIRVGMDPAVCEDFVQIGRLGAGERLEHKIVADVIAVEMRLNELVDFGPHEFLHGAPGNFRFFSRFGRYAVERGADFAFQVKIVAVFKLNFRPEGFLKCGDVADIRFRPAAFPRGVADNDAAAEVEFLFILEGIQQSKLFGRESFEDASAHLGTFLADDEEESARGYNAHVVVENRRFRFDAAAENQLDMAVAQESAVDKKVGAAVVHRGGGVGDGFRGASATGQRNSIRTAVSSQLSFLLHIAQSLHILPGNMFLSTIRKPRRMKKCAR